MPDLCFYAPWIMKEPIPDPFRMMLEKAGKKRISYDEADCSMRNIRKQGKVSRLHGPTLHALLTLIQIRKEKDSGAAGIQRGRDTINYFCMEYPGHQGKYVMTYNSKNGRFSGTLKTEERNEKLPGIREGKNTGEQYLALLAYANLVPDNPLFNEEFQKNFYILEEQEKKEWEDTEATLRAAFICCDAMYCEVIANPQQAVPLEKSQFRAEELEDVLPEYKIAAGVYAPNDEIYGKFHVLLPVNEKTKRTLFELKQIYSGRWDVNERTKERIPSLPEDYLVSKEAEEILQMVDKTPARLFMMTGDAGTGKTTDARMIAQILGLPYYVFTCGPGTDELELLATTVPNMGGTAHLEMELPSLEDIEMDPASALATVNGIYEEGISREKAFREILKAVYEKGYEKSKNEKDFLLKESEIVKACREPSVLEIQEPAMIEKPGTLTRLNSLFDDGAVTDLVNGEQIRRNPDTIVIMTTNLDYVGCQNFNQSVLSRMNLIQPKEALTEEEMVKRAMKRTGFKNKELLSFMAATVCKIHEYLIEQDITDGVCGYRELENWVLSYMVSNDLRRSALNGCSGLPALMDKLLAQDPSWKNLKTELNISDAFVAENKSNIQKFIYEGGAEIMTSFLNRQPKKKEEIRRIVNAELLGKFMELKYHGGDLGREIAFPIKRDTEEIWKEKLLHVDCGWEIWEEDSLLPVMQIGEVPLRSCISYRNGPNCDCLLSCFDANKKIIFIKHNGKIVFRAILRLTKGSFVAADERKTIEFVDVTAKSEPHENKAEELVLFLERYYQSGLSEQEIRKAVNLTAMLVKEKAEKLGARLVLSSSYKNVLENKNYVLTNFYMYISASKNGSQYLDSLGGAAGVSASGSYTCNIFLLEAEERREESL